MITTVSLSILVLRGGLSCNRFATENASAFLAEQSRVACRGNLYSGWSLLIGRISTTPVDPAQYRYDDRFFVTPLSSAHDITLIFVPKGIVGRRMRGYLSMTRTGWCFTSQKWILKQWILPTLPLLMVCPGWV